MRAKVPWYFHLIPSVYHGGTISKLSFQNGTLCINDILFYSNGEDIKAESPRIKIVQDVHVLILVFMIKGVCVVAWYSTLGILLV